MGWLGCKTSAGTHRRYGMRWGTLFWLDSVVKARLHEFAILFDSIWRSGRAVEGGKRYRWPTTPRRGGGWIRLIFPRPPIIVNRLGWSSTTCGIPTFVVDAADGFERPNAPMPRYLDALEVSTLSIYGRGQLECHQYTMERAITPSQHSDDRDPRSTNNMCVRMNILMG